MSLALLAAACSANIFSTGTPSEPAADIIDWDGCLTRPIATQARLSSSRIRFCGRINAAAVGQFEHLLTPTDTILEISSLGGELGWPITLAELVRERHLSVEIIGPCLSGCASYVFVAGANRRVLDHGWLGLHNTNSSAAFLAERARGHPLDANDAPLMRRAQREQELYRSLNVGAQLLLEPQARVGTICIAPGPHTPTGETEYRIHSRATFWIPTKAQWRDFGVEFEGYSPQSANEAMRIARATLPPGSRHDLVLEYSTIQLPEPAESMLTSVAWCSGLPLQEAHP